MIVTRGLGRGQGSSLAAAGLAITLAIFGGELPPGLQPVYVSREWDSAVYQQVTIGAFVEEPLKGVSAFRVESSVITEAAPDLVTAVAESPHVWVVVRKDQVQVGEPEPPLTIVLAPIAKSVPSERPDLAVGAKVTEVQVVNDNAGIWRTP